MQDWIQQGGVMLLLIALSSLLAIAVVIDRFATYRRLDRYALRFIKQFYDLLTVRQIDSAIALCKEVDSPVSRMALAGLGASDRSREDIREVLIHAGSREIPVLEARLPILSTVSYISPLLGLLGTVLGLIQSFQAFDGGPGMMAEGIWRALITTVAGLTVGIISHILYTYLYGRKERLINDLEDMSHELLEIFTEQSR
jgi:biopolymer transport protein ExbB